MSPEDNSQNEASEEQFDPTGKTVADIKKYLDANPNDTDRVKALEAEGQDRPTVRDYEPQNDSNDDDESDADSNDENDDPDAQVISEEKKNRDGNVVMGQQTIPTDEEQEKRDGEVEEMSEKAADGNVDDDYDPTTDPIIPSSTIQEQVRAELKGLGESPTLKALHENKPEEKEKDDKSTN